MPIGLERTSSSLDVVGKGSTLNERVIFLVLDKCRSGLCKSLEHGLNLLVSLWVVFLEQLFSNRGRNHVTLTPPGRRSADECKENSKML